MYAYDFNIANNLNLFIFIFSLVFLYNAYLIASLHYGVTNRTCLDFCEDVGFLFIVTVLVYLGLVYYFIAKPLCKKLSTSEHGRKLKKSVFNPILSTYQKLISIRFFKLGIALVFIVILKIFIFYDTSGEPRRLVSYLGLWILVGLGLVFSKHPGKGRILFE